MTRIAWLLSTGIALFTLWWFSITGYEIEPSSDVTLYAAYENVPFEDMSVSGILHKGDKVDVFGCFDNKTDIYFFVETKAGAFAYLYDINFKAIKTWVPTQARIRFFWHAPLASLQCLAMVPEYSSLNDKRVKSVAESIHGSRIHIINATPLERVRWYSFRLPKQKTKEVSNENIQPSNPRITGITGVRV